MDLVQYSIVDHITPIQDGGTNHLLLKSSVNVAIESPEVRYFSALHIAP
jgi:hypothetical protein